MYIRQRAGDLWSLSSVGRVWVFLTRKVPKVQGSIPWLTNVIIFEIGSFAMYYVRLRTASINQFIQTNQNLSSCYTIRWCMNQFIQVDQNWVRLLEMIGELDRNISWCNIMKEAGRESERLQLLLIWIVSQMIFVYRLCGSIFINDC